MIGKVKPKEKVKNLLAHFDDFKGLDMNEASFLQLADVNFGIGARLQKLVGEIIGLQSLVGDFKNVIKESNDRHLKISLLQCKEIERLNKNIEALEELINNKNSN